MRYENNIIVFQSLSALSSESGNISAMEVYSQRSNIFNMDRAHALTRSPLSFLQSFSSPHFPPFPNLNFAVKRHCQPRYKFLPLIPPLTKSHRRSWMEALDHEAPCSHNHHRCYSAFHCGDRICGSKRSKERCTSWHKTYGMQKVCVEGMVYLLRSAASRRSSHGRILGQCVG
jgi:hypothetical protein